jgi:hypothetical protein
MRVILYLILYSLLSIIPVFAEDLTGIKNAISYDKPKGKFFDKFYPIGFSKKRFFAYVRIPADEAFGCYLWEFNIKNLLNDKIEYKIGFEHDECDKIKNFKELIKTYKTNFTNKLYNYNVNIGHQIIEKFPLKYKNDTIDANLKRIKRVKNSHGRYKTIFFIMIESSLRGKKNIGKIIEVDMDIPYVYNSNINGYIISPNKDRIVVVVEKEHRGWEGPPNVSTFSLYGASLTSGFKKR